MDLISIFGIIIGISAILLGQVLEGGHISSLLQITAFLIVIGGTVGAVMLQSTVSQFTAGLKLLGWVFSPPELDEKRVIRDVIHWSQIARKNGLLALEDNVGGVKDPFTKKGLQMLVDGAEPDICARLSILKSPLMKIKKSKQPKFGKPPVDMPRRLVLLVRCWG